MTNILTIFERLKIFGQHFWLALNFRLDLRNVRILHLYIVVIHTGTSHRTTPHKRSKYSPPMVSLLNSGYFPTYSSPYTARPWWLDLVPRHCPVNCWTWFIPDIQCPYILSPSDKTRWVTSIAMDIHLICRHVSGFWLLSSHPVVEHKRQEPVD